MAMNTIHPATAIGMVTLTVADLARSLAFYEQKIGLTVQIQTVITAASVARCPLCPAHNWLISLCPARTNTAGTGTDH